MNWIYAFKNYQNRMESISSSLKRNDKKYFSFGGLKLMKKNLILFVDYSSASREMPRMKIKMRKQNNFVRCAVTFNGNTFQMIIVFLMLYF